MLRIYREFSNLDFGKLMTVYSQSNQENAAEYYPDLQESLAMLCAEQDYLTYLTDVFFRTEGAFYAVWEQNGVYVSALRMEPYRDGYLLEALETHPFHRRNGYATVLLMAALAYIHERENHTVYSHVSKRNTASLRTHITCGFQRILEHAVYIDGSVRQDSCTMCYKKW